MLIFSTYAYARMKHGKRQFRSLKYYLVIILLFADMELNKQSTMDANANVNANTNANADADPDTRENQLKAAAETLQQMHLDKTETNDLHQQKALEHSKKQSANQHRKNVTFAQKPMTAVQKRMELLQKLGNQLADADQTLAKEHKFWNTQPVPKMTDKIADFGPIEEPNIDAVQKESYPLPPGYRWDSVDMADAKQAEEVYQLLSANYVEDDDNMFRFDYGRAFLQWALRPPGYRCEWHVGVRLQTNNKLFAFISGVPASVRVHDSVIKMVEINFLCVHKKLRSKRLAPVLIKEVTRRVHLHDIWQAAYTAGVVLPKPVARNRYWHRSLNPKKLIDVHFSRLHPNMTMARTIKLYKLPDQPKVPGIREMMDADVPAVHKLLNTYLSRFKLTQSFSEEDIKHWLLPRPEVISSFVVESSSKQITDLISFYHLPSTVIGHAKYNSLKAAYSFYNVSTATPWVDLMRDALVLARNEGFDVFNALNVMENETFFKPLVFGIGDGELQYYLYNWRCPELHPNEVGLVLL